MRRRAGIGAVHDKRLVQEKFKDKGTELQENALADLTKQLEQFKTNLESFAAKHKDQIKKDPKFREYFQKMCAQIGVDPLASTKGFWSELLGMSTFYNELAIQAVEIVLSTSHLNGGIMTLGELQRRLNKSSTGGSSARTTKVSCKDVLRAFDSLSVLGKSCRVIKAGPKEPIEDSIVCCVPEELSLDNTVVIQNAVKNGSLFVSQEDLEKSLDWSKDRVNSVLERLVRDGIVWIDDHQGQRLYWFPALFSNSQTQNDDTMSIASYSDEEDED